MVKSLVRFAYADRVLQLSGKRKIQEFVAEIFKEEGRSPCRLQYIFCGDEYLFKINLDFLKHDTYTDIITFDLSNNPEMLIEGEIYISIDRVKSNAVELGFSFDVEMLRVIFHGALHLCGYDDKTKTLKVKMREREDYYLQKFTKE
jgi:rRNA maturation RNase YbeY